MAQGVTELDFATMEPKVRAVALVGSYLQYWALMELEIDKAIEKILHMTNIQRYIVVSTAPFISKCNILKTLLDMSYLSIDRKETHERIINQMQKYSNDRNVIAHNLFSHSSTNDGAEFVAVSARGKLTFPQYDWSVVKFEECISNLKRCQAAVSQMGTEITRINTSLAALLAASTPSEPIAVLIERDHLGRALPQLPGGHTPATPSASPETDDGNPAPESA